MHVLLGIRIKFVLTSSLACDVVLVWRCSERRLKTYNGLPTCKLIHYGTMTCTESVWISIIWKMRTKRENVITQTVVNCPILFFASCTHKGPCPVPINPWSHLRRCVTEKRKMISGDQCVGRLKDLSI